jgi:hypothetical protein
MYGVAAAAGLALMTEFRYIEGAPDRLNVCTRLGS